MASQTVDVPADALQQVKTAHAMICKVTHSTVPFLARCRAEQHGSFFRQSMHACKQNTISSRLGPKSATSFRATTRSCCW